MKINFKNKLAMRKTIIIISTFAVIVGSCGRTRGKQVAVSTLSSTGDTLYCQTFADNYTVEDTVRYQIGGELYGLNFSPSDSITVIKTNHHQIPEEYLKYFDITMYREYHFIVHNRYSNAHFNFADSTLNSRYNLYMTSEWYPELYERYLKPRLDSIQSKQIDPAIKDFNGYWVYLREHNGDYYLDDKWDWHSSFHIEDSIFTIFTIEYMEGPYPRRIIEVIPISKNCISILYDGIQEPIKIELIDKLRYIYRFFENGRIYFITPVRAIHNFEIIQYTNNTGDLI